MSRIPFSHNPFGRALFFSSALLAFFVQVGRAEDNPLKFYKNYFLTGDYLAGGVGMRDLRGAGSLINVGSQIPTPPGAPQLLLKQQLSTWAGYKYVTKTINIG